MRKKDAAIQVQRLCCLGLPDTLFVPELIESLKKVISAESGTYYWIDLRGNFSNIYLDNPSTSATEELTKNHESFYADPVVKALFRRAFATEFGSFIEVPKAFFKTDFYHAICRPIGAHHAIEATIHLGGKLRGLLLLTRDVKSPPFGKKEKVKFDPLLPLIKHGFSVEAQKPISYVRGDNQGMVILDERGEIDYLCENAKELLYFCNYHSAFSTGATLSNLIDIPHCFKKLCATLENVFAGKTNAPPVYKHSTPWGDFIFTAYLLKNKVSIHARIGIHIEKLEPRPLKIFRNLSSIELTQRQGDVALLVAMGQTNEKIASQMGISRNTVRDHLEQIYLKLQIDSRDELINTLSR